MRFIGAEHKERFEDLVSRGRIAPNDLERIVAMYILAGVKDLYRKSNDLYDFKKNGFKMDWVRDSEESEYRIEWRLPLSSSERALTTLAFDLYSSSDNVGVYELFRVLDSRNRDLALEAIRYRFG